VIGNESAAFREGNLREVQDHPPSRQSEGYLRKSEAQAKTGLGLPGKRPERGLLFKEEARGC
jgi:hypothetical protein